MTYPVTRMVQVLEAAGCTNAAAGAVALLRDQQLVRALHAAFEGIPEPGADLEDEERQYWIGRLETFLGAYLPVSDPQPQPATQAAAGEPTPLHQPKGGGRETCPGSGQPAV